jgi:glycosyltransferase involved in cell wall biosynthesis
MRDAPLVSIVTPFYNTQEYISECIESVLHQSYGNWEYTLVNNCSTDKSAAIAEHYVHLYPGKIRLVHNPAFLSQVQNYNRALSLIVPGSKYCKVVQADDVLFPQCLELMVDVAERHSSIGVVGSYALEDRFVCFDGIPYPSSVMKGGDVCRLFFTEGSYVFGSPTQLLIRSDLVLNRTPFYNETYIPFEDAEVIFALLVENDFGFVHQVLTFSRRGDQSAMKSFLDLDSPTLFQLWMLREFGQSYLSAHERQKMLRQKERVYAQLLVDGIIALRGMQFFKFHGRMLRRMGYRIWTVKVWWPVFVSICDVLFNPKWTVMTFLHGLSSWTRRRSVETKISESL